MTSTRQQKIDRARALTAAQSTPALVSGLIGVEAMLGAESDLASSNARAYRMTRSWVIDELERRYPEADAAVQAAFDAFDAASERGEKPDDPDYVAVLIANIPLDALS